MRDAALDILAMPGTMVLRDLIKNLSRSGYGEFYSSFVPLAPRLEYWLGRQDSIPESMKPEVDLFLFGLPVEVNKLSSGIKALIPGLVEFQLLNQIGGCVQSNRFALIPVFGTWMFCHWPTVNPTLYFGDDSLALMSRLRPLPGTTCLDLCTGPGIQALHCSRFCSSVVGVDINPEAVRLARLNAIMNHLDHKARFIEGNLYEAIKEQKFDMIVANPPLLPAPDGLKYPFVGCGGDDGMRITWKILEGLPRQLRKDGFAQVLGTTLSDGILPSNFDRLSEIAKEFRLDILMTITAHSSLALDSPLFEGLTYTAAAASGKNVEDIKKKYEKFLQDQGANHLVAFYLYVRRGTKGLTIQDLYRDGTPGFWYINS